MQQFYTNTIESKFIKDLIATTPLPTVDTLYKGKWIIPDCYYITDCNVVKANHVTDDRGDSEAFQFDPDKSSSQLTVMSPYKFDSSYPGLTSTYSSINDGYDSKTHYYLGNYLRCVRDLHDINLMPFYNCYNGEYVTDIFINTTTITAKNSDDGSEITTTTHSIIQSDPNVRGKKIVSIPVRFGETYSIFIDCSTEVEVMCGFYGNKGYISPTQTPAVEIKTENKYANLKHTSFRDGFTYTTPKPEKSTYPYTRFFKMFIQLPLNTESSIVVLEGDYTTKNTAYGTVEISTNNEDKKLLTISTDTLLTKVRQNQTLLSDLSLTQIAGTVSYAFSDRLIEYLTYNVITSEETITQNISRIQKYASSPINVKLNHTEPFDMLSSTPDVWDTKLRGYLFNLAKESKYIQNKFDLTGYVDKDVEQVITRGQEV